MFAARFGDATLFPQISPQIPLSISSMPQMIALFMPVSMHLALIRQNNVIAILSWTLCEDDRVVVESISALLPSVS